MPEGFNRVFLVGTLAERPELRYTRSGKAVLQLRLGITESYRDSDGIERERTVWHPVIVPGKRAESLAAVVGPGTRLYVEGVLRTRAYKARDGTTRSVSEVVLRNVLVLSGAARASRPGYGGPRYGMPESPWDEPAFSDDGQGKLF